jgi:probable phosphomutase (TIGR03848 family)
MPILLLIRHAVTDTTGKRLMGWTPGVHLSDRGREQAGALANRLSGVPVTAIYSSPLERCRETAQPLAKSKGLQVDVIRELGETDTGDWTGRPLAQLARTRAWRKVHQAPSAFRFPGGESLVECSDRVVEAVSNVLAQHPRGVVALVSHGDPIRLLLAHFAGVHLDLFQRMIVAPASVSAVAAHDGIPRILKVNDTGDLADLAPPRRRASKRR